MNGARGLAGIAKDKINSEATTNHHAKKNRMDAPSRHGYDVARTALVAQLDRVLPSEGRGRGFESRRVRQPETQKPQVAWPGAFSFLAFEWVKEPWAVCRYWRA